LGCAGSGGSGFTGSKLVAVECSLTSLTIWLRWEQAVSCGSGFAGSKLVAVDLASLVGVKLALLGAVDLASMVGVKLASLGACW